jgi:hypothetical protein
LTFVLLLKVWSLTAFFMDTSFEGFTTAIATAGINFPTVTMSRFSGLDSSNGDWVGRLSNVILDEIVSVFDVA